MASTHRALDAVVLACERSRPMDELTQALTRLADALERQAQAIDTLAHVIASQYVEEPDAEPARYLDGTPTLDN